MDVNSTVESLIHRGGWNQFLQSLIGCANYKCQTHVALTSRQHININIKRRPSLSRNGRGRRPQPIIHALSRNAAPPKNKHIQDWLNRFVWFVQKKYGTRVARAGQDISTHVSNNNGVREMHAFPKVKSPFYTVEKKYINSVDISSDFYLYHQHVRSRRNKRQRTNQPSKVLSPPYFQVCINYLHIQD